MFVHCYLCISLTVKSIEVVTVSRSIHVSVNLSAKDVDLCSRAVVVGEEAIVVELYVHIARHIIAAIDTAMDVKFLVCCGIFGSDGYIGVVLHITHETATEDVLTVDDCDVHIRVLYGVVETATENTTTEETVGGNMRVARHLS